MGRRASVRLLLSLCAQVEEFVMLTDPKLSLFTGMEEDINEADERPQHKITCFRYGVSRNNLLAIYCVLADEILSM